MESSLEITEVPGVGWKGGLSMHEAGWVVIRTMCYVAGLGCSSQVSIVIS